MTRGHRRELWPFRGEHFCSPAPTPALPWGGGQAPFRVPCWARLHVRSLYYYCLLVAQHRVAAAPGPGTRWGTKQIPCSQRAFTAHKLPRLVCTAAFGGGTVTVSKVWMWWGFDARAACIQSSRAGCSWPRKAWLDLTGTVWDWARATLQSPSANCEREKFLNLQRLFPHP